MTRSGRHRVALALALVTAIVSGCTKSVEAPLSQATGADGAPDAGPRRLAYEHRVSVEVAGDRLVEAFETIHRRCVGLGSDACEELSSHIGSGRSPGASFQFRTAPSAIPLLLDTVRSRGEVVEQSTKAVDLVGPVADVEKKAAMLADYRVKLEALQARGIADIEALIKLNHELAQVQSEIEAVAGTKRELARRIEREILDVSITPTRVTSLIHPIDQALRQFVVNLSEGAAAAVTATAYLLPFALLLAGAAWSYRRLRRRRRTVRVETEGETSLPPARRSSRDS